MKYLLLLVFISCKSGGTSLPLASEMEEVTFLEAPYFIDPNCNFNSQQFKNCETVKKRMTYATESLKSLEQRFLILDTRFFPRSQYLRHQDKVLGIYRHTPNGDYQKQLPMVKYPQILDEYQEELSSKTDHFFHQNRIEFKALLDRVVIYHQDEPDYPYGHGETLFNVITEKNPDSQVVIANYPQPSLKLICNPLNGFQPLKSFLDNSVNSLTQILKRHKINYTTVAFGKNIVWAKESLEMGCPGKRFTQKQISEYLSVYSDFHRKLYIENPKVVFFQSTENLVRTTVNLQNYPTACNNLANVIRVSYVNDINKVYPYHGEVPTKEELNSDGPQKMKKCVDVFVNGRAGEKSFLPWLATQGYSGMDVSPYFDEIENLRSKHKIAPWYDQTTFYYLRGLEIRPELLMSSSWATALVASFSNFLKQKEQVSPFLLKPYFSGKAFDPLFHKQYLGAHND